MLRPHGFLRLAFPYRIFVWMLNRLPFALPVERLRETDHLLAFFHPQPAYPFHVLILPKQAVRSLSDLDPAGPFPADLVAAAQSLVEQFRLPAWRLVVNGGEHQEFPHLHFHLISESAGAGPAPAPGLAHA